MSEHPATEHPATEDPATGHPVTDPAAGEHPASEHPATEHPGGNDAAAPVSSTPADVDGPSVDGDIDDAPASSADAGPDSSAADAPVNGAGPDDLAARTDGPAGTPADIGAAAAPAEIGPADGAPADVDGPSTNDPIDLSPAADTLADSTPAESTPADTDGPSASTPAPSTPADGLPAQGAPAQSTPADVDGPSTGTPAQSTPAESAAAGSAAAEGAAAEGVPEDNTPGGPSLTADAEVPPDEAGTPDGGTGTIPAAAPPADIPPGDDTIAGAPEIVPQAPRRPGPGPGPGPGQRPGRPGPGRGGRPNATGSRTPSAVGPGGTAVDLVVEPVDPQKWGRIDTAGVVYVYSTTGERPVGNWQAGDQQAGLTHFGRRFDDFLTEIALLEARLAGGSGDPKATRAHAVELRESVDTLAAVGDFDSAAARLEIVIGAAEAAMAGASQARAAARQRAVSAKEALCVEAEHIAESTSWKSSGDRLKAIVEQWRTIHGIDRKTDDALWKRFAKARDTFTRHRGAHFADMDKQRTAAREVKDALIARAEALSSSSEWGKTAGEYRQLMEEWKASGRAPRETEDELWGRFRAAQEKFFSRRNKTFSERDAEFDANAATKEKLLAEAERIDPVKGLDAARSALRSVQERWEAAGKVPRERIRDLDGRLRAVEDRVKKAEDSHWRRTDPETVARIAQFRARAEGFRAQEAKALSAGDERRAAAARAQAAQWEEWLAAAEGAAR